MIEGGNESGGMRRVNEFDGSRGCEWSGACW